MPENTFAPYGAAHVTLTWPTGRTQSFVWSGITAMDVGGAIRRSLPVAYPGANLSAITVLALPDPVGLDALRTTARSKHSPVRTAAPDPQAFGEALVTVERGGRTETFPWGGIEDPDVEGVIRRAIAHTMPDATVVEVCVVRTPALPLRPSSTALRR